MTDTEREVLPFKGNIPRYPGEPRTYGLPTARTTVLFDPQRVGTEPGEVVKAQRLNFFVSSSEAPVMGKDDDYMDSEEAERESDDAEKRLKAAEMRVSLVPLGIDKAAYRIYMKNEDQRRHVENRFRAISDVKTTSHQVAATRHILRLGAATSHHFLINRMRSFDQAQGTGHYDTVYALYDWSFSGMSLVSLAGVRPIDFINNTVGVRPNIVDAFRFLVEAHLLITGRNIEQFNHALAETQGELFQRYPNITKNMIALAATAITYSVDLSPESTDINARSFPDQADVEILKQSKKYINRAQETGKAVREVLTNPNPNSPEFVALVSEIQGYMAQGRFAELRVLDVLGMKDTNQAKNLYRKARELSAAYPEYTAFYTDLSYSIKDFQIEAPADTTFLLTSDDIPTLLDEERINAGLAVRIEDIGRAVDRIHPSVYKQTVAVEPDSIDWSALVKPTSVIVIFNKDKPRNFKVHLVYQNPAGETATLEGEYRIHKGSQNFELNFLEDQNEIPQMYQAVLLATISILEDVRIQIELKRASSQKTPSIPKAPLPPIKKTSRIEIVPVEVLKVKTRPDQPLQNQVQTEEIEAVVFEPEKSQLLIDEVSRAKLQKQLERLNPEDRSNVWETINRFNNGGSIRFYPLKSKGPNGEDLFALRAQATVRGGSRILATPIKDTSNFTVLAAGYRKDIYRDWGLE